MTPMPPEQESRPGSPAESPDPELQQVVDAVVRAFATQAGLLRVRRKQAPAAARAGADPGGLSSYTRGSAGRSRRR